MRFGGWLGVAAFPVLALLGTSCTAQRSTYLYDAAATAVCLKKRPEYVPGRVIPTRMPPNRLATTHVELHVFKTYVYPTRITAVSAPSGTLRLHVVFSGPAGLVDLQPAEVYFFSSDLAARRLYESEYKAHLELAALAPERSLQRSRNVVILWIRPDAPAHFRTILSDCLETRR